MEEKAIEHVDFSLSMAADMPADTEVVIKDRNLGLGTQGTVCIRSKDRLLLGQFVPALPGPSALHLLDVVFIPMSFLTKVSLQTSLWQLLLL